MKLLVVIASDDVFGNLAPFLNAPGLEVIRYHNALKAMDNAGEIDPAVIIISAVDFPRHWKTLVQLVRNRRSKTECQVILLREDNFIEEENAKALHLGVFAALEQSLADPKDADTLKAFLSKDFSIEDTPAADALPPELPPAGGVFEPAAVEKRKKRRFRAEHWEKTGFMFSNPIDGKIVTGAVRTISSDGLSFELDRPGAASIKNLKAGNEIPGCSLRAGDAFLSPACILRKTGKTISLEIISLAEDERKLLDAHINEQTALENKINADA